MLIRGAGSKTACADALPFAARSGYTVAMADIEKRTRWIFDILSWPYGVFVEAFVGVLYPATSRRMARRRKVAVASLIACLAAFAIAAGLSSIQSPLITAVPFWGLSLVLLFVFLIAGKLCATKGSGSRPHRKVVTVTLAPRGH